MAGYLLFSMATRLPKELLARIAQVTNKRARLVLDTIAQKGAITTEELQKLGYEHAPRAARDVRELGFTLVTTMVKTASGKRMAKYSLALDVEAGKTGRLQLPKKEREAVIQAAGGKCQLCGATYDLQVDHRVPYQVVGESLKGTTNPYMVLDGTCNRRKSWICEHCPNLLKYKRVETCQSCYWADPEKHTHVAMGELRRVDVVFSGDETKAFDEFRRQAQRHSQSVRDRIKKFVQESGE
ncbi:MAG TPA: hypothetical protein VEJ47_11280 [Candidatus Eremiobacteraceae bacterium]|nr:hypothetical protein [Candidatus Eremiobacteraceae bacterium]